MLWKKVSDYLVGREASSIFNENLEATTFLLYLNRGWPTQVAVRKVTVTKCQRIDGVVVLVVDGPIINETTDASSLQ